MGMRLGGYARRRSTFSALSTGNKLFILGLIIACHAAAALWWSAADSGKPSARRVREYVTYYDITPMAAPAPATGATAPAAVAPAAPAVPAGSGTPAPPR